MTVTRELSVVYGATTIGGASTTYLLDYPISIDEGPDRITFSFPFVFVSTSEATFDSGVAALETAFGTPRQRLRLIQGSATLYDFDPATNIGGFNAMPTLIKQGDEKFDSGRSRRYMVRVELDRPADLYSQSGRRHAQIAVEYTPARRRTLTLSGEWTAETSGATAARASYLAGADTYAGTITTALTGTWEKTGESFDHDETNKVLRWSQKWEELIFNQASGTLNHSSIVDQVLIVRVSRRRPGDSPAGGDNPVGFTFSGSPPKRLREVSVEYSAWVDHTATTDLVDVYTGTVRPWLIETALDRAGNGSGALVEETPGYDGPQNRITCSMTLLVQDGSPVVELRITTEIADQDLGIVFIPAWTGNEFSNYEFQGPALRFRTVTRTEKVIGGASGGGGFAVGIGGIGGVPAAFGDVAGANFGGGGGFGGIIGRGLQDVEGANFGGGGGGGGGNVGIGGVGGGGGRWVLVSKRQSKTPITIGTDDKSLSLTEITSVSVERWSIPLAAATRGQPPTAPEFNREGLAFEQ